MCISRRKLQTTQNYSGISKKYDTRYHSTYILALLFLPNKILYILGPLTYSFPGGEKRIPALEICTEYYGLEVKTRKYNPYPKHYRLTEYVSNPRSTDSSLESNDPIHFKFSVGNINLTRKKSRTISPVSINVTQCVLR
jgi:hypothetical protein